MYSFKDIFEGFFSRRKIRRIFRILHLFQLVSNIGVLSTDALKLRNVPPPHIKSIPSYVKSVIETGKNGMEIFDKFFPCQHVKVAGPIKR